VEDIDVAENRIHIRDRGELPNGAEIKTIHAPRSLDVSSDLIDGIVAYVGQAHTVEVSTNHLFLKLHGLRAGQALAYAEFDSLFRRLRRKTGIAHVIMRDFRSTYGRIAEESCGKPLIMYDISMSFHEGRKQVDSLNAEVPATKTTYRFTWLREPNERH
jgi:hypothetical protein